MTFSLVAVRAAAQGGPAFDSWSNLRHVTHHRTYIVVARDGKCAKGKITSVSSDSLTLRDENGREVSLPRHDVLKVWSHARYIIYSGRSSWADAKWFCNYPIEQAIVQTKAGRTFRGGPVAVTDQGVDIGKGSTTINIPKEQVLTLDGLSWTPLSDSKEYWAEECGFPAICALNPTLWPRLIKAGRYRVRLYDATQQEDNSPLTCKP